MLIKVIRRFGAQCSLNAPSKLVFVFVFVNIPTFKVGPVHHPLEEDHEDEVAEDEDEEDDLGEELEDDGVVGPVVDFVPHAQEDPKGHVDHPKYQRDLHLVAVQKRYRV